MTDAEKIQEMRESVAEVRKALERQADMLTNLECKSEHQSVQALYCRLSHYFSEAAGCLRAVELELML